MENLSHSSIREEISTHASSHCDLPAQKKLASYSTLELMELRKQDMYSKKMTDVELEQSIINDPDWEGLDDLDWSEAKLIKPPQKKAISIRLDNEVINFFKSYGKGYQTHINEVLRVYMNATLSPHIAE